jgi:hypothetical protein
MTLFNIIGEIQKDKEINLPFINYYLEDKSNFKKALSEYVDIDDDFLLGYNEGILMNFNFIFINTEEFSEVANRYIKFGSYCDYQENTEEYIQFWKRETQRRRKGMVANCKLYFKDIDDYFNPNIDPKVKELLLKPLRITGSHYNYLNYSRINRTQNKIEQKESIKKGLNPNKTVAGFSRFWDGDYWKFKLDEFIVKNGFNSCDAKARRKGFTYKEAADTANELNLNPKTHIIHAAFKADQYLTDANKLTFITKENLNWYEDSTYWQRGFISETLENIITGYKESKSGNKLYGDLSTLISVSLAKNTSAAAGATASKIKFEESGINPVLQEALDITISTTEVGANKVGNIRIFGTGGTKGGNWSSFCNIYYNPKGYNMLPMENVWDINSRDKLCGFFFPQIWCYEPYIDEHGNSKIIDAYYYDLEDKEKQKKIKKGEELLIYIAQRANMPQEAFLTTNENIFTSIELTEQIKYLKYSDDSKYYLDGILINNNGRIIFKTNDTLKYEGIKINPFVEDVPFKPKNNNSSCLRIYNKPFRLMDGDVPKDIYFISYDTVRINKNKNELTNKHSLNSFKVWEKPNSITGNSRYRIVASYCGRFDTMEETDRLVLNVCEYYNCSVLFEYGTGETYQNFKKWNSLKRLLKDPTNKLEDKQTKGDIGYGIVIGDGEKKLDGLSYLREWLYSSVGIKEDGNLKFNLHYIPDLQFLLELEMFDNERNFDRISDAIVAIYYIRAQQLIKINKLTNISNNTNKRNLGSILNTISL